MKIKIEIGKLLLGLIFIVLLISSCRKDNFIEPPDPFEPQRLEEAYVAFEFVNGIDSFRILTNKENVTITEKGNARIRGTIFADRDTLAPVRLSQGDFLLLQTNCGAQKTAMIEGYGEVPISSGKFKMFNPGSNEYTEFCGFGGYSEFVLPKVGIVQDMEINQPDGAPILFGLGSDLPEEFPVNADRTYFYFYYEDEVDFALSQSNFMINRMAIDPDDPYFYVHSSAMSIPGLSSLVDGGFAVSVEGMIPFRVPSSLDFGKVENFDHGNILLEGSIDLKPTFGVPLLIADATAVFGFGNMEDGRNFFQGEEVPMNLGLKGGFLLSIHDLAQWQLGEAAVSLQINGYDDFEFRWAGWFSNEIRVMEPIEELLGWETDGTAWDMIQPPGIVNELKTWGTIGTDPDNWAFGFTTESILDLGFMNVDMGGFKIYLSKNELDLDARMRIGFFGNVYFGGYIKENGSYRIKAGAYESESFSAWGLTVKYGYDVGFQLDGYSPNGWDFCLKGEAYLDISLGEESIFWDKHPELLEQYKLASGDLKGKISVGMKACLNNSGKFKGRVRFSFLGIGHSFDFSFTLDSGEASPAYNFQEIPLDEVPLENRFGLEAIQK